MLPAPTPLSDDELLNRLFSMGEKFPRSAMEALIDRMPRLQGTLQAYLLNDEMWVWKLERLWPLTHAVLALAVAAPEGSLKPLIHASVRTHELDWLELKLLGGSIFRAFGPTSWRRVLAFARDPQLPLCVRCDLLEGAGLAAWDDPAERREFFMEAMTFAEGRNEEEEPDLAVLCIISDAWSGGEHAAIERALAALPPEIGGWLKRVATRRETKPSTWSSVPPAAEWIGGRNFLNSYDEEGYGLQLRKLGAEWPGALGIDGPFGRNAGSGESTP